jgi:hypothetical protein
MRALSPTHLLDAWDDGECLSPARRALLLLALAWPDMSLEARGMERWPLGRVNARLLTLRAGLFGGTLVCLADCAVCGAVVESELSIDALLEMGGHAEADADAMDAMDERRMIEVDGMRLAVRAPCIADLLALSELSEAGVASMPGAALLARLVDAPSASGRDDDNGDGDDDNGPLPAALPSSTRMRIEQCVAELDPLAYIELSLACPECGHPWHEPLHVVDMLWTEIGAFATRLLHEVAQLAHAFGWSEREILHMPSTRRRRYLELLGS